MDINTHYQNAERKRKAALCRQDARAYAVMCTEVGIRLEDVEDMPLFERGIVEASLADSRQCVAAVAEHTNLRRFIAQAELLRVYDFALNFRAKREVLETFFPRRFGRGGLQSLRNKRSVDIGACFKNLYEYALDQCEEES